MPIFTRSQLKKRMNAGIKGKIGVLIDEDEVVNATVRQVITDIDLTSLRRKNTIASGLFNDIFEYAAPSDLLGNRVISIKPQAHKVFTPFKLVSFEEFFGRAHFGSRFAGNPILSSANRFDHTVGFVAGENVMAVRDDDAVKRLLLSTHTTMPNITISTLDEIAAGGGSWTVVGDAINVKRDGDNFIRGNGSIRFDISAAAGTTAGIQNVDLNPFDITDFFDGTGAIFVFAFITSTTGITNFEIRIGSGVGDFNSTTIAQTHENLAFQQGWNLLRFDFADLTSTGTPILTTTNFVDIHMNKLTTKINEVAYRFDHITMSRGELAEVFYQSRFGWQTATGVRIENSTADDDLLLADTNEFDLYVEKSIQLAGREVDERSASEDAEAQYKLMKTSYEEMNPSESKIITDAYATFI